MDSTAQSAFVNSVHQQKLSRFRLRNNQQKCFHRRHVDLTAQTAYVASEIINETASTGDAWIRHRKQPLGTHKSSMKLLPRVTHGFDSAISPCGLRTSTKTKSQSTQKSSTKMLSRGHMDSTAQTAPVASEIINETASTGDA